MERERGTRDGGVRGGRKSAYFRAGRESAMRGVDCDHRARCEAGKRIRARAVMDAPSEV